MKRLITIGDSFSNYAWPMWPTILGQVFDLTENYARAGMGNFFICQRLFQVLKTENLSKNDTVIVQWSEPLRYDFIVDGNWHGRGSKSAEDLIAAGLDDYVNFESVNFRSLVYMDIIINLLEKTECDWYFIFLNEECMVHKKTIREYSSITDLTILHTIQMTIRQFIKHRHRIIDEISISESARQNGSIVLKAGNERGEFLDNHPTPWFSYKFIEQQLSRFIDLDLKTLEVFSRNCERFIHQVADNCNGFYDHAIIDKEFRKFFKDQKYKFISVK